LNKTLHTDNEPLQNAMCKKDKPRRADLQEVGNAIGDRSGHIRGRVADIKGRADRHDGW
jgi:hypothetical protein